MENTEAFVADFHRRTPDRRAGPSSQGPHRATPRFAVCGGREDPREGTCGAGGLSGGLRFGAVGASERRWPGRRRADRCTRRSWSVGTAWTGTATLARSARLSVLEGLAASRGGDVLLALQRQLPLAGADPAGARCVGGLDSADTGDGGGLDRPRLVDIRVDQASNDAIERGHRVCLLAKEKLGRAATNHSAYAKPSSAMLECDAGFRPKL